MSELAREFAVVAHSDQRYGDLPYVTHLADVASVAEEFAAPAFVRDAAWLHDTLEDTATTFEELVAHFGVVVADLVEAVTDKRGNSRAEIHAATYPTLRRAGKPAVQLKLCDRLANARASSKTNPKKLAMYQREWTFFRSTLQLPGEHKGLWAALAKLLTNP